MINMHLPVVLLSDQKPFVVVWCRFYNESSQDMEMRSDLQFDPSGDFHTYQMVFGVSKEDTFVRVLYI